MITTMSKLKFRFRRFILLVQMKKVISITYNIWQQHKQLKTKEMRRFDLILSMRDIYTNSNLNPLTKVTSSSGSIEFKDILSWNTRINHPNQQKNSHKQCNETGHPVVNIMESQWKLRQQHEAKKEFCFRKSTEWIFFLSPTSTVYENIHIFFQNNTHTNKTISTSKLIHMNLHFFTSNNKR